jgi:hypothetical protein
MSIKEIAITVAIAILFTTLVLVTIDVFYARPEYDTYCNSTLFNKPMPIMPSKECSYNITAAENECFNTGGNAIYDYDSNGCQHYKECSFCNKYYEDAVKKYSNNIFLIIAPIGVLAILFGVFYSIEFLGSGFMFAGIILMLYSTMQNFSYLNKYLKVIIILVELLLVLFIAYKKVVPEKKSRKAK